MKSDYYKQLIEDLYHYECDLNDEFTSRHNMSDIFDKDRIYKNIIDLVQDVRDIRKCVDVLNG